MIMDSGKLEQYSDDNKLHSVFLEKCGMVSFAVRRGNSMLLSVLNKTIKTMSASKFSNAVYMYDSNLKKVTVKEFIRDNFLGFTVLVVSVFLIVLILILGLLQKARIAEKKAKEAQQQAEKANSAKTDFLRHMSHDIRTPLNGIIGMINISERYCGDKEKLYECKAKVMQSMDYLQSLLNNVLDIGKVESGTLQLVNKPFDLVAMLVKQISIIETNAKEYGISFEGGASMSTFHHRYVIGSEEYLNRLLMNLAGNAVKYNRSGGKVSLYFNEISSDDKTAVFEFVCSDTGLGMSEEFQKHAFESYAREGKETTNGYSGAGLGLSIVKDIVDMMNGTIKESQPSSKQMKKKPVIVCGDFNVAATELDIKNPKANVKNAGFTLEEREKFKTLLDSGFTDTYRYLHPDQIEYSWWSYRFKARERNAGWRIDYFLTSDFVQDKIRDARIHTGIMGSDHCPVELDIDL